MNDKDLNVFLFPTPSATLVEDPDAPVAIDQVDRLRREMGEGFLEVVREFLTGLETNLQEMKGQAATGAYQEIIGSVSKVESSAAQMGALRLSRVAKSIRKYIRSMEWQRDRERLNWLFLELDEECAAARDFYSSSSVLAGLDKPKTEIIFDGAEVLIVAPDDTTRAIVRGTLEPDGYRLWEAHTLEEAVTLFRAHNPVAVLVDDLSIQGGTRGNQAFKLCSELRALDKNTPILVVTEYSDELTVRQAVESGASDFISRPIYMPVLRQRMRYMCGTEIGRRQVSHMAMHDMLTGLPNRNLFNEKVRDAIAMHKRMHRKFAVIFIDLDGFKKVNDTLGHDAGDEVLRQAASRMLVALREEDILARMGGDEFVGIISGLGEEDSIHSAATIPAMRILEEISRPFDLNGIPVNIGASIGLSVFPDHGEAQDELVNAADSMMYRVKAAGKNSYRMFEG